MTELNSSGFDDIRSQYEAQYETLRKDLESLQDGMAKLSETAYSEDGLVMATVGAQGELKDLVLDARIYRVTDATALATTIAETIRDATSAVTARILELTKPMLAEHLGMGDELGSELTPRRLFDLDGGR